MNDPYPLATRSGLPDALRVLVTEIPRNQWEAHPEFGGMVQFWLDRHQMFRRLVNLLDSDFQRFADKKVAFDTYAPRLSQYGGLLLSQLHEHHQIEDHHYFPRLVTLDPRLEDGFALLERDHEAMDKAIHALADAANSLLRTEEKLTFEAALASMTGLLERHLTDEEDLIVPVILKSGFQG